MGLLLDRRAHLPFLPRGAARGLGWMLLGGGAVLNGWFLKTMRDAEAPIRTDKPVPRLTTEGPFRYSRNPSYLALAAIHAGIAVLRNSLWVMLLLPLVVYVIQHEVIGREERYLERTFGEEYLDYKGRVAAGSSWPSDFRRTLLPRTRVDKGRNKERSPVGPVREAVLPKATYELRLEYRFGVSEVGG